LFGKNREHTSIVATLFDPLDSNSNKVLSFRIFFDNLSVSMNTFGTPKTSLISFSEERNLTRRLNLPDFKDYWRISIMSVINHSVKLLDKA
jgi:hypothetical protein